MNIEIGMIIGLTCHDCSLGIVIVCLIFEDFFKFFEALVRAVVLKVGIIWCSFNLFGCVEHSGNVELGLSINRVLSR